MKGITDGPIEGFAIAGNDRCFQPADVAYFERGRDNRNRVQLDKRKLVLTSPLVPNPIHFRYAWGRNPMGNLQSSDQNDLPFATQRSDDWKMEEVPVKFPSDESRSLRDQGRQIRNEAIKTLRLEDLRRRLEEAQTLLDEQKERYESERTKWEEKYSKSAE